MLNITRNTGIDPQLSGMITILDNIVTESARAAYNLSYVAGFPGEKKLEKWLEEAKRFLSTSSVSPFLYTSYGYAVERITNIKIGGSHKSALNSTVYSVSTQANYGATIPDIVIRRESDSADMAWLDITSEDSRGHINRKAGSGWARTPFVAELLYPPLNIGMINPPGSTGIGSYIAADSAYRKMMEQKNNLDNYMRERLELAIDDLARQRDGSKPKLVIAIESRFGAVLPFAKHSVINSMLREYIKMNTTNVKCNSDVNTLLRAHYSGSDASRDLKSAQEYIKACYERNGHIRGVLYR